MYFDFMLGRRYQVLFCFCINCLCRGCRLEKFREPDGCKVSEHPFATICYWTLKLPCMSISKLYSPIKGQ